MRQQYRSLAVLVLNTLLLFLLVNLAAWVVLEVRGANRPRVSPAYDGLLARGFETLRTVYPEMADAAIRDLLRESWTLPLQYEPYTQFREREVRGRYVNVAPEGYRRNGPGAAPWPPAAGREVFLFGGSTTFGYGLPDEATLAARLEARLRGGEADARPIVVYNFGRAYYNSTQERVLFERLLAQGNLPRVAVFVDGLNDTLLWPRYRDTPQHTLAFNGFVDAASLNVGWGTESSRAPGVRVGLQTLPAVRLARGLLRRAGFDPKARREAYQEPSGSDAQLRREAGELAAVYARNRRLADAAARAYGAETLFVLQPVPWHRYDVSLHLFRPPPDQVTGLQRRFQAAYSALREEVGGELLDCTGVLEGFPRAAYVDTHHYTAEAADLLAQCVVGALRERLDQPGDPAGGPGSTLQPE